MANTNDSELIDVLGGATMPPDTTIPQQDVGGSDEIEISLVDEPSTPDTTQAEAQPRRAQNDPVETDSPDPLAADREAMAQERRDFQQLADRSAKEIAEAHKQRVATERRAAKGWLDNLDSQRKVAIEAIKAAKQDGDVAAEVDFQLRLQDIDAARRQIIEAEAQLPSDEAIDVQVAKWRRENVPQSTASNSGIVPGNELAVRYKAANTWLDDPAQARAREYFLSVDRQLSAEGYDPKTPAHFEELSRRVAARFPSVGVKMLDGRAVGSAGAPLAQPTRPTSAPVASARVTSAPGATTRRNTVQITDFDRRMLRSLGMDPTDKAVQQRFAREKLARQSMERR